MASIQHEKGANIPEIKISPDKFAGHVVIVTGAGSGIGEVTARLFAQQGAQVVLYDIDEQKLKSVQSSIQQSRGKADIQLCDVSNEQIVNQAVEKTIEMHGKIDIIVNIAGIYPFHSLVGFPTDIYLRTISVNLNGSFFITRAVLPYMQKAGYGRIIHTSSSTTGEPEHGLVPYIASKSGVIGLTRAAAVEAGPGITVNVVLPGLTDTAGVQANEGSSILFDHVVGKQIVKRRGHPLDIAHTYSFIASPEASFFTGQCVSDLLGKRARVGK